MLKSVSILGTGLQSLPEVSNEFVLSSKKHRTRPILRRAYITGIGSSPRFRAGILATSFSQRCSSHQPMRRRPRPSARSLRPREEVGRSGRKRRRAHVPVDLAAGTRDFRVALDRGSPWTLGAAESAEAPNIEVRERCVRPRGTTSLSPGTASGCGVREDAPGKCRRWESDASGNEISPRSVEVSKKEKVQNEFSCDWCS